MTNDTTVTIDEGTLADVSEGWTLDFSTPTRNVIWDSFSLPEMTFDTNGVLHVTGTNVTGIKWTIDKRNKTFWLDGGGDSNVIQLSLIPRPEIETALGAITVEEAEPTSAPVTHLPVIIGTAVAITLLCRWINYMLEGRR